MQSSIKGNGAGMMNYELNLENVRLRSLVEATETDLFEQKKKRRRLEKENENLSASIKGMASAKVNLNESYQDLEKLYERLEKENAALVKENEELKGLIEPMLDVIGAVRLVSSAAYKCIRPDFIEKLKEAGSK